jgi:hypothetical protein
VCGKRLLEQADGIIDVGRTSARRRLRSPRGPRRGDRVYGGAIARVVRTEEVIGRARRRWLLLAKTSGLRGAHLVAAAAAERLSHPVGRRQLVQSASSQLELTAAVKGFGLRGGRGSCRHAM